MKLLFLCALHITILVSHPAVQDKIKSKEHDITCNYLNHHLRFLKDATKDCTKLNLATSISSADQKLFCDLAGEQVIKNCATDKACILEFLQVIKGVPKL